MEIPCAPLSSRRPRRTATNAVASCDSSRLSAPTTHLIWTSRYWSARSADVNIRVQLTCPYRKPHPASEQPRIGRCSVAMTHYLRLLVCALTRLFRSRARFEAEILVLRHQLNYCGAKRRSEWPSV